MRLDLVECEDGKHVMAYCYLATEHCVYIAFAKPQSYDDAREFARGMKGCPTEAAPHANFK